MFKSRSLVATLLLGAAAAAQTGCNLQKFAADQTVQVVEAGSLGFNGFWDYEIFGAAVPSAILQSEALVQVSPDNEALLTGLARTYVSYAYGWLGDRWELADERGDFEAADELERRIFLIYDRAARLGLRVVHRHDKKGQLARLLKERKVEPVQKYLRENFKTQEDVPGLYWAGLSWGSAIANSGGDMNQLADAPIARALVERSVELDPGYNDASALAILGTVEASFPELFGGNLETARAYYERALKECNRRNHLNLLSYAKVYAVAKQDRALFLSLLKEILESPDLGPDIRMANKVARHRALRYIKRVDAWFDPAMAPGAEEPAAAPEAAPEAAAAPSAPAPQAAPPTVPPARTAQPSAALQKQGGK